MPIHCPLTIRPLSDAAFDEIDRVVMACAYASQNTLGRLCEEHVYESDVAARLRAEGFTEAQTQVPVMVTHGHFSKTYRLDLVVRQMVYELKVVAALAPEQDTQAVHYAALLATDRVKLLNFRTAKVVGKLMRTPFARLDRTQVTWDETRWQALSDHCDVLKQHLRALLGDWGAYLEVQLYDEGLVHLSGGVSACTRRVPLVRDGLELGAHRMHCHAHQVAFHLTAMAVEHAAYEHHLRRLLQFTSLQGIQWVNLNHSDIQLVTLKNRKAMEAKE